MNNITTNNNTDNENSNDENNLWSSFLKESSKRTTNQETTCIIVGNPNSGKKSFVQLLCQDNEDNNNMNNNDIELEMNLIQKEIVSYNYFNIDDKLLESSSSARVSMWAIGKHIFNDAYNILKTICEHEKIMFIIMLDLSSPDDCINSLLTWLEKIAHFIEEYYNNKNNRDTYIIKSNLIEFIKNSRLNKGDPSKNAIMLNNIIDNAPDINQSPSKKNHNTINTDDSYDFITDYFGLPIMVVATKLDSMPIATGSDVRAARELQGRIRKICLDVGASLMYVSSFTGENCEVFKQYLMHRLYPDQIGYPDLNLDDNITTTFIPTGYDTLDLISIASGNNNNNNDKDNFITYYKELLKNKHNNNKEINNDNNNTNGDNESKDPATEEDENNSDNNTEYITEIEDEQSWLKNLQSFILQVTSSGNLTGRNTSDSNLVGMAGGTSEEPITPRGMSGETRLTGSNSPHTPTSTNDTFGFTSETGSGKIAGGSTKGGTKRLSVRQSFRKPTGDSSKDAGDFFKNLLDSKSKK